jgi:hypothetical protein
VSSQIITPGPSEILAAMALLAERKGTGVFPYQWIFPGPSARPVIAEGIVAPSIVPGQVLVVVEYDVPTGERFVLDGVVFQYLNGNTWVEGSGTILWNLVVNSAGDRTVEWFVNVASRRGSNITGPYPVPKTLEFAPRDILQITATFSGAGVTNGLLLAQIVGHTYPNSEAL